MLHLLRRNSLLKIQLHQITQIRLPFLLPNLISNGNLANPQTHLSPRRLSFFSSAASNLRHESPITKEPIFHFFYSFGFTEPQIKKFLHKYCSISSTEIIKPKFEHLLAVGLSPSELIRTICLCPNILGASLKERIEPNLSLLETTIGSKTHMIRAIIRGPWLIPLNLEKRVIPKVKILRENGIPMDNIIRLFMTFPRVLIKDPNLVVESISKLKGLSMSPSSLTFIHGMDLLVTYKKETWERKMGLFRSFGLSEEDTLSVFSRQPTCLEQSDDNMKKKMNFFMEKLQWDSALVAKRPGALELSLEGRIIPRCAVMHVLANRKLWEGKPNLYTLFKMSDEKFKERFEDKYENEVPRVIDAYQGKIVFVGFESRY